MRSEFLLPFPPSTNSLFANRKGGRYKTKKYEAWIDAAGWMIRAAPDRHNRHLGPVTLRIQVRKPDERRRDIDNLSKGILDLLVSHQIMADDSQVQSVSVAWSQDVSHGALVIVEDL